MFCHSACSMPAVLQVLVGPLSQVQRLRTACLATENKVLYRPKLPACSCVPWALPGRSLCQFLRTRTATPLCTVACCEKTNAAVTCTVLDAANKQAICSWFSPAVDTAAASPTGLPVGLTKQTSSPFATAKVLSWPIPVSSGACCCEQLCPWQSDQSLGDMSVAQPLGRAHGCARAACAAARCACPQALSSGCTQILELWWRPLCVRLSPFSFDVQGARSATNPFSSGGRAGSPTHTGASVVLGSQMPARCPFHQARCLRRALYPPQ